MKKNFFYTSPENNHPLFVIQFVALSKTLKTFAQLIGNFMERNNVSSSTSHITDDHQSLPKLREKKKLFGGHSPWNESSTNGLKKQKKGNQQLVMRMKMIKHKKSF